MVNPLSAIKVAADPFLPASLLAAWAGFGKPASGDSSCTSTNYPKSLMASTCPASCPTVMSPASAKAKHFIEGHLLLTSACFLQVRSRGAWLPRCSTNAACLLPFSLVQSHSSGAGEEIYLRSFLIEDNLSASAYEDHVTAFPGVIISFHFSKGFLRPPRHPPTPLDAAKSLRRLFCWQLLIEMCLVKHNE